MNLFDLIEVEIQRGSEETSASLSKLAFKASMISYNSDNIELKLDFESPLSVSKGDKADKLKISFLMPELFMS